MEFERRLSERKTLEQRVYIKLPGGNGGIVFNVSEGGLGFHALDPVEPCGPIPFWFSAIFFSANSKGIEGTGEVVWTDEAKKTGGLRFTEVSARVHQQIRCWPNELEQRLGSRKDTAVGPQWVELPDDSARDESAPLTNETSTHPTSMFNASRHPELFKPQMFPHPFRWLRKSYFGATSRGPFKAICVSVLAVMVATVSYFSLREAGERPIGLGRASRESRPHAVAPSPASNLSSEGISVDDAFAKKSKMENLVQAASQLSSEAAPKAARPNAARPRAPETPTSSAPFQSPLLPRGMLILQVGAFAHEANARKLAESLRQRNFPAFLSITSSDGGLYQVQVGPYADEESARLAQSELGKAGFKPFIRH